MDIKVLKTFELTDEDWVRIEGGFNRSFERTTTKEQLIRLYTSTVWGYSYHAVGYEQDEIIGFTSIMPFQYLHKNQEFKAGLSCSSFVLKEYRKDIFIFQDMYEALKKECLKHGYTVFLGVPNENSHKYSIVLLGSKNVDNLPYYALPSKWLTVLKKDKYTFINVISAFCVRSFCCINMIFSYIFNFKEKPSEYRLLITDAFLKKRFSAPCYSCSTKKNIQFRYRIVDEKGIQTAYLMDFREHNKKTNKALCTAVRHILREEKIDIILYIGTLHMKQGLLLKVPSKFVPKPLPLTFNMLDVEKKERFATMSNIDLWDFSLINFDGR